MNQDEILKPYVEACLKVDDSITAEEFLQILKKKDVMNWKSRHEHPPKDGDKCLVVDRYYSEIYFDTATQYHDSEIRFTDKGDEFYILESEIITLLDYEEFKSKAKPY